MTSAPRDENFVPAIIGTDSTGGTAPVLVYADKTTHRLLVNSTGGTTVDTQTVVITGSLPSGSNTLGTVTIQGNITTSSTADQTVHIVAGSAIIGSVSITGSLPTLPSGSNTIGSVSIVGGVSTNVADQTVHILAGSATIGSVTVTSIQNPLPSGSNTIGSVTILGSVTTSPVADQTVHILAGNAVIGSVNISSIAGTAAVAPSVNVGVTDGGTQRVTLGNGSNVIGTVTIGALSSGSNTIGSVSIASSLPSGSNQIGTVQIGGSLPAGSNAIGTVTAWSNRNLYGSQQTSIYSSTSTTTIVTAGGAGIFNDIYGLTLTNFSASAVKVRISDSDSGNSTIMVFEVPATDTRGFMLNPLGAWPQTTSNKAWTAQTLSSSSVEISALYIKRT